MAKPRKVKKKLILKKNSVIRDDLKIKNRGLYVFMLYANVDRSKKTIFKLGQTTKSFHERVEHYHGYTGPDGVRIVGFLSSPTRGRKKGETQTQYYEKVEEYAFQAAFRLGMKFMWTTTRIKLDGRSENLYGTWNQIEKALQETQDLYGGTLQMFSIDHVNDESGMLKKKKPVFVGETIFPIRDKN